MLKILNYIDRINLLHKLISEKKTGSLAELALRLHVSKSRMFRIIEELKLAGVPIAYSREKHSYYYTQNYKMQASLEFTALEKNPF